MNDLKSLLTEADDQIVLEKKCFWFLQDPSKRWRGNSIPIFRLANSQDNTFRLLRKCNLDEYLWEQLERLYGYNAKIQLLMILHYNF